MSQQEAWLGVLDRLRESIPARELQTWLAPLSMDLEDDRVVLTAPNRFFVEWIEDRFRPALDQAVAGALGRALVLELRADAQGGEGLAGRAPGGRLEPAPVASTAWDLNQRLTFETFVVGPCNELAHASAWAVAQQPGRLYNPLLIYGGAGLGKTHLLMAVGNHLKKLRPGFRVHYCSAEAFTNELLQAVRFDGMAALQEKFRQVDCLMVDDIQFLAGLERTQEEFFHTFNALAQAGKQMVLSGDKIPREISGLEKRLRTRFEGGLVADVQPPDEETKAVILQRKAAERGMELSRRIALFLARQPENNVRVLEGYLTRVIAVSSFQGVELTLDLVRRLVGPLTGDRLVGLEDILTAVANAFGVKVAEIKGNKKNREVSLPRQVAMYLARRLTRHSFPEIGRMFGGKDHSTVVKGVKKMEAMLRESPSLAERVREVERGLREGPARGEGRWGDGG